MTNKEAQDCISRADAITAIQNEALRLKKNADTANGLCVAVTILYDMPLVTPQELIHRKCNQCKYYEGVIYGKFYCMVNWFNWLRQKVRCNGEERSNLSIS